MHRTLAFRCDGDAVVGAGHVARCLPLAGAFAGRGWHPVFVGAYSGLAAALLARAGFARGASKGGPCGLGDGWAAAVIDSYALAPAEICAAAEQRPTATIAEARRCPGAGVVLDYHVDAPAPDLVGLPPGRLVAGPAYAPLEPKLLTARRPRRTADCVLVTVGGTEAARMALGDIVELVARQFPSARLLVPPGTSGATCAEVLPETTGLVDVLPEIDLAVSAAGVTAYELACAGIPSMVVALADNQRRVARACDIAGIAVGVDGLCPRASAAVQTGLERLADPDVRLALSTAGPRIFDGHGAERAAQEIERRWLGSSVDRPLPSGTSG